jgi:hypothetical protein
MGGRFLGQRYTGSMMSAPFEGVGYTGYDNVTKKYWGTWIDRMSPDPKSTIAAPRPLGRRRAS